MTDNIFNEFTLPTRRQLMILKEKHELTVREVANLFSYNPETVRRKIQKGTIPAMKRGNKYYIPAEDMYKAVSTLMLALSDMEITVKDMPEIYERRFYIAVIKHPEKTWEDVTITFDVRSDYVEDEIVIFSLNVILVNGERLNASGNNATAEIEVVYDERNLIKGIFIYSKWKGENDFDYHPKPYQISSKWRMVIYWLINHFILKFHREEMRPFIPQLENENDE